MTRHITNLKHIASLSDPSCLDALLHVGRPRGPLKAGLYDFDEGEFAELLKKFTSRYSPSTPRPLKLGRAVACPESFRGAHRRPEQAPRDQTPVIRTTEEEAAAREATCRACEFFRLVNNLPCCKKIISCSGGLPRKWKLKNAHCPEHFWNDKL